MDIVIQQIRRLLIKVCENTDWCDECPINKQCFAISSDKNPAEMEDEEIKTLVTLIGDRD